MIEPQESIKKFVAYEKKKVHKYLLKKDKKYFSKTHNIPEKYPKKSKENKGNKENGLLFGKMLKSIFSWKENRERYAKKSYSIFTIMCIQST